MDKFERIFLYTINHLVEIVGLLVAYLALLVPIRQYLGQKELEEKDKRFNNYHRLIDELVGSRSEIIRVDKQIAVVFELRNYSEYYEVTKRILQGLLVSWKDKADVRLVEEIHLTINFIATRPRFIRFLK